MRILVDMNLSPLWCEVLQRHGHECLHWSQVGDPKASDSVLLEWAAGHGCVVLTHDLDFSAILAATGAKGPSVIQVRTQDAMPPAMEGILVHLLRAFEGELAAGAILVADESRARVRVLPLSRPQ